MLTLKYKQKNTELPFRDGRMQKMRGHLGALSSDKA